MDEECEIPSGSDLFRVTVWDKSGTISDYDSYATSVELAISHDKEMVKILVNALVAKFNFPPIPIPPQ